MRSRVSVLTRARTGVGEDGRDRRTGYTRSKSLQRHCSCRFTLKKNGHHQKSTATCASLAKLVVEAGQSALQHCQEQVGPQSKFQDHLLLSGRRSSRSHSVQSSGRNGPRTNRVCRKEHHGKTGGWTTKHPNSGRCCGPRTATKWGVGQLLECKCSHSRTAAHVASLAERSKNR